MAHALTHQHGDPVAVVGNSYGGLVALQLAARHPQMQSPQSEAEPGDVEVDLAAVTVPVTIFNGARDFPTFTRIAEHLASEIPGARHVQLDWAGHLPGLERPRETAGLLTASLVRWP